MGKLIFQHENFEHSEVNPLDAELNKEVSLQLSSSLQELASLSGEVAKLSKTEIQYMLKELGFLSGKIDGVLGKETGEAVKAFQRKYELPVDGILGDKTLGMLQMLYGESLSNQEGAYTWDDRKRGETGAQKSKLAVPEYAIQTPNPLAGFSDKYLFAKEILPMNAPDVNYEAFLKDPAIDIAMQISNDWVHPVGNSTREEVRMWVARSMYLEGKEATISKENVQRHLEAILKSREIYSKVPIFNGRNVACLTGKPMLKDQKDYMGRYLPTPFFKRLEKDNPSNVSIIRGEYDVSERPLEAFLDKIANTPPPATFWLAGHGSPYNIALNDKLSITDIDILESLEKRYKKFPELLDANSNMQDIFVLSSCNGHTLFRNILKESKEKYSQYKLKTSPIVISFGEYGQLQYGSPYDLHPSEEIETTLFGHARNVTIGDFYNLEKGPNNLNSVSIYTPLTKDVKKELKKKKLPTSGIKQIATNYENINKDIGQV